MKELTLKQAAEFCYGKLEPGSEDITITGVQLDSRHVKPGDLFVAIKGEKADGHDFVSMAAKNGARAALVSRPVEAEIPTILVSDTIRAYGDLAAAYRERVEQANKAMAARALRVLACAERRWDAKPVSDEPEFLERELCFTGLCGMIDPVRPEVAAAIKECREAGIRPIMITGDHIDTAAAIARELGILTDGTYAVTGAQLSQLSDEEFSEVFKNISVYARVQPEHKTRIVNAWRAAGYVTAMTGDGVNDAPSIKSADIGVGMGLPTTTLPPSSPPSKRGGGYTTTSASASSSCSAPI